MIKPTIGRGVLFYKNYRGPLAAIVVKVHSDTLVNLTVFRESGEPHSETNVELLQPLPPGDQQEVPQHAYCSWTPHQVAQAQRTELLEKLLGVK